MGVEFESEIPEEEIASYDDQYAQRAREIRFLLKEIETYRDKFCKDKAKETVEALLSRIRHRQKPEPATVTRLKGEKPL